MTPNETAEKVVWIVLRMQESAPVIIVLTQGFFGFLQGYNGTKLGGAIAAGTALFAGFYFHNVELGILGLLAVAGGGLLGLIVRAVRGK